MGTTTRVPFKVKDGLDANQKKIINVADPVDDYDALNLKFFTENAATVGSGQIFVSNVTTAESGKNVLNTLKNNIAVTKATTAATTIKIIIEFERGGSTDYLPNIQWMKTVTSSVPIGGWMDLMSGSERNGADLSLSSIIMINGTLNVSSDKPTFTFEYNVLSTSNGFYHFKNGARVYTMELSRVIGPVITNVVYTGSYPSSQTELRDGQTATLTVTSDSNIYAIEANGTYINTTTVSKSGVNLIDTVNVTIANGPTNTDTAVESYVNIRVQDEYGTWSNVYTTSGPNDYENFVYVNNTIPVFSGLNISYPGTKLALDNADTATITYSLDYLGTAGTVTPSDLNLYFSNILKNSDTNISVTANNSIYSFDSNTLSISATRVKNGRTTIFNVPVNIASVSAVINQPSVTIMRSGLTGNDTSTTTSINQRIKSFVVSLPVSPSGITVQSQGTLTNNTTTSSISSSLIRIFDAAVKETFTVRISVVNLSERTTTTDFTFENRGFTERTMTGKNITSAVEIPNVVNGSKVLCSIGDSNNLIECSLYSTNFNTVRPYGFSGDAAGQIDEFQVYLSTGVWYIVFDENVISKAGPGGWLTNARIRIEETL